MPIEFQPPALKSVLVSQLAGKRLKNRDGYAVMYDQEGKVITWAVDGPILKVYQEALKLSLEQPNRLIHIIEDRCGQGSPDNITYNLRLS